MVAPAVNATAPPVVINVPVRPVHNPLTAVTPVFPVITKFGLFGKGKVAALATEALESVGMYV